MTAQATIDPVQADVEATLRRIITDVAGLPCQLTRSVVTRVTAPVQLLGSLGAVAVGSVLDRWKTPSDADAVADQAAGRLPNDRHRERPAVASRPGTDGAPGSARAGVAPQPSSTPPVVGPPSAELPIDGYELLAASQIVGRLERLDDDQLAVIEAFETAHRHRRTILGKIEQIRSGR